MARDEVDIPDHHALQGVQNLTLAEIRSELNVGRVDYKPKAFKADLLPLLVLFRMGLVDEDHAANHALLLKVTAWCSLQSPALRQELADAGIEKGVNKWFDIENLILAELEDDLVTAGVDEPPDEPGDGASVSSSLVAAPSTKLPKASVMNFLVSSFCMEMIFGGGEYSGAAPGCPVDDAVEVKTLLQKIPLIKDRQHLTEICKRPAIEGGPLVSWLCSSFGSDFIEATEESGLKVPGFPESVLQFVFAKPAPARHNLFKKSLEDAKDESILLFRGTNPQSLQTILRHGFSEAGDHGIFMSEEPLGGYYEPAKDKYHLPQKSWNRVPLEPHGVLLGCQVTGKGRPGMDSDSDSDHGSVSHSGSEFHAITQLHSIAVRYIFLVALNDLPTSTSVPRRAVVEPAMTAAFKVILRLANINAAEEKRKEVEEKKRMRKMMKEKRQKK